MIPSVSVVVPCHQQGSQLEACVRALLVQAGPPVEIVIADAGSTDHTLHVARGLVAEAADRVTLLYRAASSERADLLDAGVRVARGEYLICVDPGERPAAGFVEDALREMTEDFRPGTGMFSRSAWERYGGFAATSDLAAERSFTTVAFADELVAHPELVAAYGERFSGDDDATLVVYAPDTHPAELGAQLEPVLSATGLDGPTAPEVMGVAVPAAEGGAVLAAAAQAVLSRRQPDGAFAAVPRFDDSSVAELRALAEYTWAGPRRELTPMESFYAQFVSPGDLVFDIGANLGNRTETFLGLGARVVAVEPQTELAQQVRARWDGEANLTVHDCALSDTEGEAELLVADAHTLTSMATDWIEEIKASGRFAEHTWNERRVVRTRTLASLIEEHGEPVFCKIDVEGFEETVLAGLDRPVAACSLEFASEHLPGLRRCLERLAELGPIECNYSEGESMHLARPDWVSADELMAELEALPGHLPWGDVYVRTTVPQRA